ncbi:conserved hypothetical protein [Desulfamplus magnetovallimortis]|uniref:HEAT repeat domain-containing protein n=1 Tax=Desulfamplus magnetovallimortis TaxID=1246637 RepID=A0A1W1H6Y6_9BACT|nr:DVU0298 family protein [Desulfamplus magnetovallimortis]SLM28145.1 conserved hypothetical protein [Desulfamplus magnetovallimortis]
MRKLKQKVYDLLTMKDEEISLENIVNIPGRQVVNPLFSFIQHSNESIKWRAVKAMGRVVNRMADNDIESARIIMRRLMWSLNDESGGIGWGAPEAMGEIMAQNSRLAREYRHILFSYVDKNGNYLEYAPLRNGALWAIERLCQSEKQL